ncbi:ImmA/IrrE family metallo-endopeptidase [soil metagenome]
MARTREEATRNGAQAAGQLQRRLDLRARQETDPGAIDIFDIIAGLDLPLMMRPLKGLLGAFLNAPAPGILITTERPLSIQRFTAAHELGHYLLDHQPSLDDEDQILRRGPLPQDVRTGFQETEADAFAVAVLMPKWLIHAHCARQGWRMPELRQAEIVYQLSLRLGGSYEATTRTLERYALIDADARARLLDVPRRDLKAALLEDFTPTDYRGNVWLLTERDQGGHIDGSRNDLFVIRLPELGAAGYLWDFETLAASGFTLVRDARLSLDADGVGGPNLRRVVASPPDDARGLLQLAQRRPWLPDTPIEALTLAFDLTGPEERGLSRAERRQRLAAA